MSERGFTGVFVGALLVGIVATVGVYRLLVERGKTSDSDQITTVPVVIAATDIVEGALLASTDLRVTKYADDAVPEGAFAESDSVEGRVALIPIFAGEPVLESKLAPVGSAAGLEVKVQPGRRAMSMPVNEHVGINGLIQPNSRVDVLVTLSADRNRSNRTAKLFLQNMRVLSVGQHLGRGEDGKPITASTVTLEVTPEEAELLAVAMNEGVMQLALRGFGDPDSVRTRGATSQHVLGIYQPPRPARPKARPRPRPSPPRPSPMPQEPAAAKIQIFRGNNMTETTVEPKPGSSGKENEAQSKKKPD